MKEDKKVYVKPIVSSKGFLDSVRSRACSNGTRSHCLRS